MEQRARRLGAVVVSVAALLSGCGATEADREAAKNLSSLNVLDEAGISEIMLTFADPNEAVKYFQRSLAENPDRVDFSRGYASSLLRAGRTDEAVVAYKDLLETGEATDGDQLRYAEALVLTDQWDKAEEELDKIAPTFETYDRYRIEAMMSDYREEWARSDAFYGKAEELTSRPAPTYNNWGISKMSRGDQPGAEEMFRRAIAADPSMFQAKNNLAIARARSGSYELPVVPMTEVERAQLLHNVGVQAMRNGDQDVARGLFAEAIDSHPQYFEAAASKLEALERQVIR